MILYTCQTNNINIGGYKMNKELMFNEEVERISMNCS